MHFKYTETSYCVQKQQNYTDNTNANIGIHSVSVWKLHSHAGFKFVTSDSTLLCY